MTAYVDAGYVDTGYVEDVPTPAGGYPSPSDVRAGVVYGASGEYTGTYLCTGIDHAALAAALLAASQVTPLHVNVKQVNDSVIEGAGVEGDYWRPV
jgi:hypothetical protein